MWYSCVCSGKNLKFAPVGFSFLLESHQGSSYGDAEGDIGTDSLREEVLWRSHCQQWNQADPGSVGWSGSREGVPRWGNMNLRLWHQTAWFWFLERVKGEKSGQWLHLGWRVCLAGQQKNCGRRPRGCRLCRRRRVTGGQQDACWEMRRAGQESRQ